MWMLQNRTHSDNVIYLLFISYTLKLIKQTGHFINSIIYSLNGVRNNLLDVWEQWKACWETNNRSQQIKMRRNTVLLYCLRLTGYCLVFYKVKHHYTNNHPGQESSQGDEQLHWHFHLPEEPQTFGFERAHLRCRCSTGPCSGRWGFGSCMWKSTYTGKSCKKDARWRCFSTGACSPLNSWIINKMGYFLIMSGLRTSMLSFVAADM